MPDYRRLVSYIYNYEDGNKKNNVGYARVEARNGQCKCTIRVTVPSLNDKQLRAYMFKREDTRLHGVLLGNIPVRNGVGEFRFNTDPMHIMNTQYSIMDMGGLILMYTDKKYLATVWDEVPLSLDMVLTLEGKEEAKASVEAEKIVAVEENPIVEQSPISEQDDTASKANVTSKEDEILIVEVAGSKDEVSLEEITEETKGYENGNLEDISEAIIDHENNSLEESTDKNEDSNKNEVREDLADNPVKDTVSNEEISVKEITENDKDSSVEVTSTEDTSIEDEDKNHVATTESDQDGSLVPPTTTIPDDSIRTKEERIIQKRHEMIEEGIISDGQVEPNISIVPAPTPSNVPTKTPDEVPLQEPEELPNQNVPKDLDCDKLKSEELHSSTMANALEEHPLAMRLYRDFPRIHPFEDNELAWCVRIEPKDIGMFPVDFWPLSNNSFLLHGYYGHRHLLFGKVNNSSSNSYILGVPGIYHNRERFMARMFGFENFKCAKRRERRIGEFGYWYIPILLK